ncbi:MAG TPA: hypothetical protein VLQ68_10675, partial [Rhizobiaceae bacterium]|nr:hypothetical protein [Rhizobiaceae bacterium]
MTTPMHGARPSQLPLELPVEAAQERDDLIVSRANALAVDLIDSWPRWPGSVVVLAGPPGSGKSHLARAWSVMSGAQVMEMAALDTASPPPGARLVLEDAAAGTI